MKRLILALTLILFPTIANAQAGFIFGYALGSMGGSSNSSESGVSGNVIYQADSKILASINPLNMHMVGAKLCSVTYEQRQHGTLWGWFSSVVKEPENQTIIQITRVLEPNVCATLWFMYVNKREVKLGGK
jgi:hypothetical protein